MEDNIDNSNSLGQDSTSTAPNDSPQADDTAAASDNSTPADAPVTPPADAETSDSDSAGQASEAKEESAQQSGGTSDVPQNSSETPVAEPAPPQDGSKPIRQAQGENNLFGLLSKCKAVIAGRKQKKLDKILEFAKQKTLRHGLGPAGITNDEVQKLVLVSDKTATRYLEQLMKEGKLIRTGPEKHEFYKPV